MNPVTLNNWAYNGDRLWTSIAGQHRDYGRVLENPGHPKPGDLVETDTGRYRLGEPLMQESSFGWFAIVIIALMIAIGLGYKLLVY